MSASETAKSVPKIPRLIYLYFFIGDVRVLFFL